MKNPPNGKASEVIAHAAARIAAERVDEAKAQKPGTMEFLQKISGSTDEDLFNAELRNPHTWVLAILGYLDDLAGNDHPSADAKADAGVANSKEKGDE